MSSQRPRAHRRRAPAKRRAWVLIALAPLTLGACTGPQNAVPSRSTDASLPGQVTEAFREQSSAQEAMRTAFASLESPPDGVVRIDGAASALTSAVVRGHASRAKVRIDRERHGEFRGFERLCAGQVDLVDSSRRIDPVELTVCRDVGLDVVQLWVASEAIVIAIRAEGDVGGDCLSFQQVKEVFRAGSSLTNWTQDPLGLADVPIEVGGPDANGDGFDLFGRQVLDSAEPALLDVRSDYRAFDSADDTRLFLTGNSNGVDARDVAALQRARDGQRDLLIGAEAALESALTALKAARAPKTSGDREKDAMVQDRRGISGANALVARMQSERDAILDRFKRVRTRYMSALRTDNRFDGSAGNVAFFLFSYYDGYADRLRPLEITGSGEESNCVFPSRQSIVNGDYPLARQLLLTTTTRSLERPEVQGLLDDYLSGSSTLAPQVGLVAPPRDTLRDERSWVTEGTAPTLAPPSAAPDDRVAAPTPPAAPEDRPVR